MASTTGKYLKMVVNGVTIAGFAQGEVTEEGDDLDAADANSGGREQWDDGVTGPRLTATLFHKIGAAPFSVFGRGSYLASVYFYPNFSAAPSVYWFFERLIVLRCSQPVEVHGQIKVTFEARNAENAAGTSAATYTRPNA